MSNLREYILSLTAARALDLEIDTSRPFQVRLLGGDSRAIVFYGGALGDPDIAARSGIPPADASNLYVAGRKFGAQLFAAITADKQSEKRLKRVPWDLVRNGLDEVVAKGLPLANKLVLLSFRLS